MLFYYSIVYTLLSILHSIIVNGLLQKSRIKMLCYGIARSILQHNIIYNYKKPNFILQKGRTKQPYPDLSPYVLVPLEYKENLPFSSLLFPILSQWKLILP